MEKGDLSNEVVPRLAIVFEGLIGRLDTALAAQQEKAFVRLRRYKRAAHCWTIDRHVTAHMWDLTWRHNFSVDVLTYKQDRYAEAIEALLDEYLLPVSNFISTTPEEFSKRLAY